MSEDEQNSYSQICWRVRLGGLGMVVSLPWSMISLNRWFFDRKLGSQLFVAIAVLWSAAVYAINSQQMANGFLDECAQKYLAGLDDEQLQEFPRLYASQFQ